SIGACATRFGALAVACSQLPATPVVIAGALARTPALTIAVLLVATRLCRRRGVRISRHKCLTSALLANGALNPSETASLMKYARLRNRARASGILVANAMA